MKIAQSLGAQARAELSASESIQERIPLQLKKKKKKRKNIPSGYESPLFIKASFHRNGGMLAYFKNSTLRTIIRVCNGFSAKHLTLSREYGNGTEIYLIQFNHF